MLRLWHSGLDAQLFEDLLAEGRQLVAAHNPGQAAAVLRTALGLWQDTTALADIPSSPLIKAEAERLTQLQLAAMELRVEAEQQWQRRAGRGRPRMPSHTVTYGEPEHVTSPEDFARELSAARTSAGLTVAEVAAAASISFRRTQNYFTGDNLLDPGEKGLASLRNILAACGIVDLDCVTAWTDAFIRAAALQLSAGSVQADPAESRGAPVPTSVIPDAPGHMLCPDPLKAKTAEEFVNTLNKFRAWAGNPSFRIMQKRCNDAAAASTICLALQATKLPSLKVTLAIVTACDDNTEKQQAFVTAWRAIQMKQGREKRQGKARESRKLYSITGTA